MTRGEHIYNFPLYSFKRFFTFLRYSKPVAKKVAKEIGSCSFCVLLDMIWCNFRYGAMDSRDYLLFEFWEKSASERNSFFTKRRYFRLIKHFDKDTFVYLGDKDNMYKEYKSFIKRNWILVNSDTAESCAKNFLEKYETALVKPVSAEQGSGIFKISKHEEGKLEQLLLQKDVSPFLMEELLSNCDELNAVNSHSLNTLRVYTVVPKGETPKVVSTSLRCGCGNTVVDNWGSGGIGYPVDLDLGIICSYGKNKKGEPFAIHPGSQVQMIGMKIPFFREAIDLAITCTLHNANVLYAGIDIALTPNGPELIELNFPGGHDFLQTLDQVGKNSIMQSILG